MFLLFRAIIHFLPYSITSFRCCRAIAVGCHWGWCFFMGYFLEIFGSVNCRIMIGCCFHCFLFCKISIVLFGLFCVVWNRLVRRVDSFNFSFWNCRCWCDAVSRRIFQKGDIPYGRGDTSFKREIVAFCLFRPNFAHRWFFWRYYSYFYFDLCHFCDHLF